nr:MAG TPA: YtzH-like protein [Caudoviricetes sp.]DAU16616.1 MAG TPA: YtzH-like protein [Caudoviricetes sp.]
MLKNNQVSSSEFEQIKRQATDIMNTLGLK